MDGVDKVGIILENVENSLSEVDVIPIPGPPGSFLPSPGGSEVLQESSALTSSRVLTSQDIYALTDRESSGSPFSATSAISHPYMGGTDVKHLEHESVARPPAIQDKISNLSYHSTKPAVRDTSTFPCMVSVDGAERTNFERENVKFTVISPSKGSLEYSDDQTCCCSRKEGASWGAVLMCEESNFPGQPVAFPAKGKEMSSNQDTRPEVLASPSICLSLKIDKMMVSTLELPTCPIAMKNSHAASVNFPSLSDSYSATSSSHAHPRATTHPVLRLMGKNLTVVNKDEDTSKLGECMSGAPSGGPNANY
ncbi:uncharacterized protein LOC122642281 isoform X2 [Telopea speciosissima]|uniref:uncharacterized protein LOC122642281 isoform X2 n=1 Tax=Telopea speciosissima TaxID=54955 RepID=UPI001CC48E85|nr:uncharacterized protein LOC122642281 isoform X2 [Telopea speciosissima]